ncbi:hypothetical protein CPB86DRAFT_785604 [Serendipita vermifera]|nr:hypothetical protein CPB86DRAFT_785604 [Serendipita vermifera]
MRLFYGNLLILGYIAEILAQQARLGAHNLAPEAWDNDQHEQWLRNATDNLLFTTVASFLQQWPNTRYRNGHAIVRGTIPVGTILYHARPDKNIPLIPEWLAFNIEHSYLVCYPPECWMHTFEVEEELKVVYFDGSSGANSIWGHQDTQDVVLWGKPRPDKNRAERERIVKLCQWAQPFGLDAIIRMEPGFEVMLCDFTKIKAISNLHLMSYNLTGFLDPDEPSDIDAFYERQNIRFSTANLTMDGLLQSLEKPPEVPPAPRIPPLEQPLPEHWVGPIRGAGSVGVETVLAAGWNSFYPGEVRVKLDYSRLVSFYDPAFLSLVQDRQGLNRHYHRLTNLSRADYLEAMRQLDDVLTREDRKSSAFDWSTLTRSVTDRYSERLLLLRKTLQRPKMDRTHAHSIALRVRDQLLVMLMPSMIYGVLPRDSSDTKWVEPMTEHCSTWMTKPIKLLTLSRSERMIKRATEGVLQRICTTLTSMWVDALSVTDASDKRAMELVGAWNGQVNELMDWLDWPMWDVCHPACPEEKHCYIPTWPFAVAWGQDGRKLDMTPKCIDRYKPLPGRSKPENSSNSLGY